MDDDGTMDRRSFLALPALLTLAGCGVPLAQRSDPRPVMQRAYDLRGFRFAAAQDLEVSERESFYPTADIVWRGDPFGDRVAQIGAMFAEAAARNRRVLNGPVPVDVMVQLVRFHGVTNRTRYTVGGNYNIVFDMTVYAAGSNTVIEPTRRVVGNLDAPGGETAVRLEESGQTQKVRVTDYLTGLLRSQLV